jgi:hypothetical protein
VGIVEGSGGLETLEFVEAPVEGSLVAELVAFEGEELLAVFIVVGDEEI